MRSRLLQDGSRTLLLSVAAVTLVGLHTAAAAPADESLVVVRPGADVNALARRAGSTITASVPELGIYTFRTAAPYASQLAAALAANPAVATAEPNGPVRLPEAVNGEQHVFAFDAQSDGSKYVNQDAYRIIDFAEPMIAPNGKGVTVAVLDTGAQFDHPDLKGHLVAGINAINPGAAPVETADGATNVGMGHGTFVAGLITRLASRAHILVVRVLNGDGEGTLSDVIVGLHYAVTHGATVVNMSFGTDTRSDALDRAIRWAQSRGVVLVAAAGNLSSSALHYPAACDGVCAVASVSNSGVKSDFSDYGQWVSVAAPGEGLQSTYWDWMDGQAYASGSGTSFSAPLVAGMFALMLARGDDAVRRAWTAMDSTAHPLDALNAGWPLGRGMIDVDAAVSRLRDD